MDPNETLRQLRELGTHGSWWESDWPKAQELFEALDEWLSRGSALPDTWKHKLRFMDAPESYHNNANRHLED